MGIAVGIVAKSIWASQKARSEGGGSPQERPPGSVHMTRQERSEVPTNLGFGALGGSFGSTHRSSLLVWCSFGQVVMAGRAGRPPAPSVLLSVWSMSVRRRREAWDR